MRQLTFSIVVPIIPSHNIYLHRLIANLEGGSLIPKCIIIAASSQTKKSIQEIRKLSKIYNLPFQFTFSEDNLPPGQNRNRGWELADTDYVTFCDADDIYAYDRISILRDIAMDQNADLILHNYTRLKPATYLNSLPRTSYLVSSDALYKSTFPLNVRNRKLEIGIAGDTNILLPIDAKNNWKIHHGHATVKRALNLRYGQKFRGEDGEFCRDVLFAKKHIVYTPNKLSNYDRPTMQNLFSMSVKRIHSDLALAKKYFKI